MPTSSETVNELNPLVTQVNVEFRCRYSITALVCMPGEGPRKHTDVCVCV